jgi:hypothetical protein
MERLNKFDSTCRRQDRNFFTQTPARYHGFWNDLGEAGKAFLPKWLYVGTYVATGTYVALDTYYTRAKSLDADEHAIVANLKALDTAIWHSGATLITTPVIVNYTKKGVTHLLKDTLMSSTAKTKVIPACVGIAIIPLIVPVVDHAFHELMNASGLRPAKVDDRHWGIYEYFMGKH